MNSASMTCAILVANGAGEQDIAFAQRLFSYGTRYSGAVTLRTVSTEKALFQTWSEQAKGWGHCFPVDTKIEEALSTDFDALIIPGGARSIEKLKQDPHSKRIIDGFFAMGKPVVALGDGGMLLADCDVVNGVEMCAPEAAIDALTNKGVRIVDGDVTIDRMVMSIRAVPEFDAQAEISEQVAHHIVDGIQSMQKMAA